MWFSFFHEAGHLLQHSKRLPFLEGASIISEQHEEEADKFARDVLIPPNHATRLSSVGYSKAQAKVLAAELGVSPGILVGRLQRDGLLPWTHLNDLKVKYEWAGEQ